MNGTRLGSYQLAEKQGLTKRKDGTVNPWGSIIAGAACGAFGAIVGSPFYLVNDCGYQILCPQGDYTIFQVLL